MVVIAGIIIVVLHPNAAALQAQAFATKEEAAKKDGLGSIVSRAHADSVALHGQSSIGDCLHRHQGKTVARPGWKMTVKKALLALADGTVFEGRALGYEGETVGEVVFNTAMTGYQEILTDPSYKGQIVTMTCPHIGNYGITPEDAESRRAWAEGFMVMEASRCPVIGGASRHFRNH